jgi:hypothetical protein
MDNTLGVKRMRQVTLLGCLLALAAMGCGGDDGGGGSHTLACDIDSSSSNHVCLEFSWNGPENAADAYSGQCEEAGANTVSACPGSGKVGGCRYTASSGTVTVTWTNWYYFGTAADLMQGCVGGGGLTATWVNP